VEENVRSGVVERVFAVLAAFDDEHRALRLTELARRANLPANTTLRLARALVDAGALERDGQGRYVVGLGLFEIAALAPRGHGLRRIAMPYLGDLSAAVGQHVLLTVRDGDKAVLVERLSARGAPSVKYRIGGRLPLDGTGAGLVLLAHAPTEMQTAHEGHVGTGLFAGAELRRRLADIRTKNALAVKARPPVEVSTAAAPVRLHGRVVAAVSVVVSAAEVDVDAVLPAVVAVATSISRTLSAAVPKGVQPIEL
jgi:DNA-binding IclR family transcriptional regulator